MRFMMFEKLCVHAVKCFCLIISFFFPLSFQTAESCEFTEQDVLSVLVL